MIVNNLVGPNLLRTDFLNLCKTDISFEKRFYFKYSKKNEGNYR